MPPENAMSSSPRAPRLAGAPISWGVCEVPGWGLQLDRERVLAEIRELDLAATEAGPDGMAATQQGLFRPLGAGDAPVAEVIELLDAAARRGWIVLEQDTALDAPPPPGTGPIDDVRRSIDFVRSTLLAVG
jgi:hypothetical protein